MGIKFFWTLQNIQVSLLNSLIQWNNMVTGQKHSFVSANYRHVALYCRPTRQTHLETTHCGMASYNNCLNLWMHENHVDVGSKEKSSNMLK